MAAHFAQGIIVDKDAPDSIQHMVTDINGIVGDVHKSVNDLSTTVTNLTTTVNNLVQTPNLPCGRLTLTSGTPVLTADTTAQGTIYYTPYTGDFIPVYDGTNFVAKQFVESSVVLDATNFLSGSLYDLFIFSNSGTPILGYSPAWTSITARSAAIIRLKGIWTNSATITLRQNSSTVFSVPTNQATYVGTAYGTANGQTGMSFLPAAAGGGTANILGLFNAYNRVRCRAVCRDSTATWTYASTPWRKANNSANNSISYVDGLGELFADARYVVAAGPAAGCIAYTGINLNSPTATPAVCGYNDVQTLGGGFPAYGAFLPALGYNTLQLMEATNAGGTATFAGLVGAQQVHFFFVELFM